MILRSVGVASLTTISLRPFGLLTPPIIALASAWLIPSPPWALSVRASQLFEFKPLNKSPKSSALKSDWRSSAKSFSASIASFSSFSLALRCSGVSSFLVPRSNILGGCTTRTAGPLALSDCFGSTSTLAVRFSFLSFSAAISFLYLVVASSAVSGLVLAAFIFSVTAAASSKSFVLKATAFLSVRSNFSFKWLRSCARTLRFSPVSFLASAARSAISSGVFTFLIFSSKTLISPSILAFCFLACSLAPCRFASAITSLRAFLRLE